MKNQWNEADTASLDPIDVLIYQARLIGSEPSLVLWGGGNSSLKVQEADFDGRPARVLRVKGSGSDMKSMKRADFPGVRLDDLLPLFERSDMSDKEMVAYTSHTMLQPDAPRPSIETLLHAFIPQAAVLHTHADAILMLTNTPSREVTVRACYGDDVIVIPYRRPGFALSKEVGAAVRANPGARGLVLLNHGLVTWGDDARTAYDRHVELVTRAEEFVGSKSKARGATAAQRGASSAAQRGASSAARSGRAATAAPVLRGLLSAGKRVILRFDDSDDVMAFLDRPDARALSQVGAATPDHMLNTKRAALWLDVPATDDPAALRAAIAPQLDAYQRQSAQHRAAHFDPAVLTREEAAMVSDFPRVILAPGIGMWTAGKDARATLVTAEIYHHTMAVMSAAASSQGGYASLGDRDAFDAEYWPLELYKLTLAPPEKSLSRRVALITGAANGIGRAIASHLAAAGAHVLVTDVDGNGARQVASEICSAQGIGRAVALSVDVTKEADVQCAFEHACLAYGGVDIVISNAGIARVSGLADLSLEDWNASLAVNATGHFLVSRAALRSMRAQGLGGSIVFNATKNVPAPGKDFGAYSAAKAAEAQLCRIVAIEGGGDGIRANMVNPDAIFESNLWSPAIRQARADAQGIDVSTIEDHYAQRNLLKARVTASDVAEAVLWLASDLSAKTTGAMIPVDGGLREAFPR